MRGISAFAQTGKRGATAFSRGKTCDSQFFDHHWQIVTRACGSRVGLLLRSVKTEARLERVMDQIAGTRIVELTQQVTHADKATEACEDAFKVHGLRNFRLATIPRAQILDIYNARFGRPQWDPDTVLGAREFLPAMESLEDADVRMASLEYQGLGFSVWLNADATRVVACMVGRDRRDPTRQPMDWIFDGTR